MKKLLALALLGMVSCALIGSSAQAATLSTSGGLLKHKKHHHHKHHKHHKS
jgi:hypothetical protein